MSTLLIALAGGRGSGKSWLATRLQQELDATRLSQDDYYLDRSHLPLGRRAVLNYDEPRALDWQRLESDLAGLRRGERVELPVYDFATHARHPRTYRLPAAPFVLVEGLWLLRRRSLRELFALCCFIECPEELRLRRQIERELRDRGRDPEIVARQFREKTAPLHDRFVAPQSRAAELLLPSPLSAGCLRKLAARIRALREPLSTTP